MGRGVRRGSYSVPTLIRKGNWPRRRPPPCCGLSSWPRGVDTRRGHSNRSCSRQSLRGNPTRPRDLQSAAAAATACQASAATASAAVGCSRAASTAASARGGGFGGGDGVRVHLWCAALANKFFFSFFCCGRGTWSDVSNGALISLFTPASQPTASWLTNSSDLGRQHPNRVDHTQNVATASTQLRM